MVGTAAAAGLAGGLALRSRNSRRKFAGIPVGGAAPLRSVLKEAQQVGKDVGKAGFRLGVGDVSMEVKRGRKDSDKRDSPLEVLLNGLTARRPKRQ